MKSTIVVGLQWGDEGKGKIIDAIARNFDYVVRWNGGHNAGHTVVVDGQKFPLSLIPSGVLQGRKLLMAQGVVINPRVLLNEIAGLEKAGHRVDLVIDPRCHIVMPYHELLDAANEAWKGKQATGSLHLGIGFCYEDRNNRHGIRLEDLIRPQVFKEKLKQFYPLKKAIIEKAYGQVVNLDFGWIFRKYRLYGQKLRPYIGDVSSLVMAKLRTHTFLFEQAHGTMLDPVFGTYPFTVAPPTIASAVFPAVGIPARAFKVLGVLKAYTTRVGNGPFPTELTDNTGEAIRQAGGEFGTVSGRPRRCGWLDLPILRYAVRLNGCTALAVTKLDVLSNLPQVGVCMAYRCRGKIFREFPDQMNILPDCQPIYRRLPGWKMSLGGLRRLADLPAAARDYLSLIQRELGLPIKYISVGPERKEIIRL